MIVTVDTEVLKETLKANCYTMCIDRNTDWCEHSCSLKRIEDLLDKAIVDAERPQGNWKGRRYYRPSTNQYDCETSLCSECEEEYSYDAETGISITDYSFCPNCGALMKKRWCGMRLGDLDALKKEFIKEFYMALGQGEDSFDVIGTMAKVIDNAPTVVVDNCGKCPYYADDDRDIIAEAFNDGYNTAREKFEKPKGEWMEKVERRGCFAGDKTVYSYTCPFCGANEFKKYPFCHCGADLRKAEE